MESLEYPLGSEASLLDQATRLQLRSMENFAPSSHLVKHPQPEAQTGACSTGCTSPTGTTSLERTRTLSSGLRPTTPVSQVLASSYLRLRIRSTCESVSSQRTQPRVPQTRQLEFDGRLLHVQRRKRAASVMVLRVRHVLPAQHGYLHQRPTREVVRPSRHSQAGGWRHHPQRQRWLQRLHLQPQLVQCDAPPTETKAFHAKGTQCAPPAAGGVAAAVDEDSLFITLFGYTFRFSKLGKDGKELSSYTF
jgi:hypothetical protein